MEFASKFGQFYVVRQRMPINIDITTTRIDHTNELKYYFKTTIVITVSNEFILSKQTVLLYDSLMGSIVNPMIVIFLIYHSTSCITLKNQKIPRLKFES